MYNWLIDGSLSHGDRSPTICCLQAGDPGTPVVKFSRSEGLWTGRADGISLSLRARKDRCLSSSCLAEKSTESCFLRLLVYASLWLIGWGPLTLGRAICFTQSAGSNTDLVKPTHKTNSNGVQMARGGIMQVHGGGGTGEREGDHCTLRPNDILYYTNNAASSL